jgi:hypothetical protein
VDAEVALCAIEAVREVAERFAKEAESFDIRKTTIKHIDALIKSNLTRLA